MEWNVVYLKKVHYFQKCNAQASGMRKDDEYQTREFDKNMRSMPYGKRQVHTCSLPRQSSEYPVPHMPVNLKHWIYIFKCYLKREFTVFSKIGKMFSLVNAVDFCLARHLTVSYYFERWYRWLGLLIWVM